MFRKTNQTFFKNNICVVIICLLSLCFVYPALAKVVKKVDANGKTYYTNVIDQPKKTENQQDVEAESNATPEVPSHIKNKIKSIYAAKYPDNYSMQTTLVADQLESYIFLQGWKKANGVPHNIFSKIKSIYINKYPNNFSMQKTLIQDQVEAYLFMQKYKSAQGVPPNKFSQIKKKYQRKYPYNFSMQKTLVEDQVNSYRQLH